jgi:hypothetical protein
MMRSAQASMKVECRARTIHRALALRIVSTIAVAGLLGRTISKWISAHTKKLVAVTEF